MSRSAATQKYCDLRTADFDDHDDSATEVSDSVLPGTDEEKCWSESRHDEQAPRSRLRRLRDIAFSARSLLDTVLLLVIVGLLLDRRSGQAEPPTQERYRQLESLGDITGFAPTISQQIKTFKPDFSYAPENPSEFFTPEVQNKWLDLVPRGLGYVEVPHPETYNNLPTPLEGYAATVFTTGVTHQLHCLYAIVEAHAVAATSNGTGTPSESPWHLNHCFEYLRQSIMCCGDTALEGQATTFPAGVTGSDGWDATHVCRSYDQVYDYLEERRANDDVWI